MMHRRTLLVVLALAFWPAHTEAQEKVVLRGRVLDAERRVPLKGVRVTATRSGREALTDSLGRFSLTLIEDYGYDLLVEDMGYVPASLRVLLEDVQTPTAILLRPDPVLLAGLATLEQALEGRRNRARTRIDLVEHDELLRSTELTAWDVVRKAVPLARECPTQRENLCRPGSGGERLVRVCIDDVRPPAGASALLGYEPRDLWLVEVYDRGTRVRVYSRWFVGRAARNRGGRIPLRSPC